MTNLPLFPPPSSCVPFLTNSTSCGDPSLARQCPHACILDLKPLCCAYMLKSRACCSLNIIACINQTNRRQPPPHLPHHASIASNLSHHVDTGNSLLSDLEQQDLILRKCLQALLALHKHHLCVSSSMQMSTGIVPPT
ncbi:hypothetical protein B0H14DRAFT_3530741 [Mycena olivaceomarginata]|nr:hypothetical protein B0H14DRAFT_3530741 [Mycena olivaceomarginata]